MKWLTARVEHQILGGPEVAFPCFVRAFSFPKAGGLRFEQIDCWCPGRLDNETLDFVEGQRHFDASQSIAAMYGSSGFVFNVLIAMMAKEPLDRLNGASSAPWQA